jgi:hypothetical protein
MPTTCSNSPAPRSPALVQAVARSWIDTPLLHRQALKGVAVDCLHLMIETGVEADVLDRPSPDYSPLYDYGRLPNPNRLIAGLEAHMLPLRKDGWGPGDVVALSWGARDLPMHVAIMAEFRGRMTMIHAYPLLKIAGKRRVREMTYAADWPDRACSFWRYPRLVV